MAKHPLDNPIWNGLAGPHARLGLSSGKVRRYRPDVAMFVAVEDPSDPHMPGLLELIGDSPAGFVTSGDVALPPGIEVVRVADLFQLEATDWNPVPVTLDMVPLTEADEPAMVELVNLTRPGPFAARTRLMGNFRGLFDSGRLVAMSGERMRVDGYIEVSAVCTHPDYRGRGYAKQFTSAGGNEIVALGQTPFLHSFTDNAVALATYEKLGFRIARSMKFTVIRRAG